MDAKEEAQAKMMAQQQMGQEQQMAQAQKAREEADQREQQKKQIIKQLLEPSAQERLQRISLVKPEKVAQIENYILMKVQQGAIQTKMDDDALLRLIDELDRQQSGGSVTSIRKRNDSDDDIDLGDDY